MARKHKKTSAPKAKTGTVPSVPRSDPRRQAGAQAAAAAAAQLNHGGKVAQEDVAAGRPILVPSVPDKGRSDMFELLTPAELANFVKAAGPDGRGPRYREMTQEDIDWLIDRFANAAALAQTAGFDGVEIHAANGYLIDQFLRDGSNRRTDAYGGSLENRSRLLQEITTAVCAAVGADRVGVRLSPENSFNDMHDSTAQQTFNHVAGLLADFGLAYLHVVEGDMMSGERTLDYRELKERFGGPYIANNGYTRERAEQVLRDGDADLVAFGRPFLVRVEGSADRRERHVVDAADAAGAWWLAPSGARRSPAGPRRRSPGPAWRVHQPVPAAVSSASQNQACRRTAAMRSSAHV